MRIIKWWKKKTDYEKECFENLVCKLAAMLPLLILAAAGMQKLIECFIQSL